MRNEAPRTSRYLGRAPAATMERIPPAGVASRRRSIFANLLGQRLAARDFDRQVAELKVPIAILHGHIAPGIPVTEAVGCGLSGVAATSTIT